MMRRTLMPAATYFYFAPAKIYLAAVANRAERSGAASPKRKNRYVSGPRLPKTSAIRINGTAVVPRLLASKYIQMLTSVSSIRRSIIPAAFVRLSNGRVNACFPS